MFASDPSPDVASVSQISPDGGESATSSIFSQIGSAWPYTNPDDLVGSKGIQIYRKMYERDPEIASSHEEIIFGVVSQRWRIECEDKEKAEFVENNLKYLGGQTQAGLVYQPLQNFLYELALLPIRDGVGVWEKVWQTYDGRVWIDSIKSKPAEDFEFNADQFGNLKNITFTVDSMLILDPRKFLIFPWLNIFQNWYGSSRYRRLYGCFWLDEICLRMAGTYAEKRAGGIWTGKYPPGNNTAKTNLLNVLRKAQSSGVAVFPSDIEVDLDDAANQGGDFFWNLHNLLIKRIRRGMIGLETTAASGDTGDKAGQESRDKSVKQPLISFASELIAQVINRQIIQPLIEYNFGEQDEYPEFEWDNSDPVDAKSNSEVAVRLYNIGVSLPVRELEEKTGWRLTSEADEPVVNRLQLGGSPVADGIQNPTPFAERKFKSLFSVKRVKDQWDIIDQDLKPLIVSYVQQIAEWGDKQIKSHYDAWAKNRSGINDLNLPYQGAIRSLFQRLSKAYYKAGTDSAKEEIAHAAAFAGVKAFAEVPVGDAPVPDDYAKFVGDFWWKKYSDAMKATMTNTFAGAFEAGKSMTETRQMWQDAMKKYGAGTEPDWYDFNRMYRNAASKSYNTARLDYGRESKRIVSGVRNISVLDDSTTDQCRSVDGQEWPLSDPRVGRYNPPSHHQCRRVYDYVYSWEVPAQWSPFPTWEPQEGFGG